MIVSTGPESPVMILGDFADKNDIANGFALSNVGALRQVFNDNGLKFDGCYRTLYIKDSLSYYGRAKKKLDAAIAEAEGKIE